jgi:1,4-alpha-glucan branching enzyme
MELFSGTLTYADVSALLRGDHRDPHRVLGAHPAAGGVVVRALHPDASGVDVILQSGECHPMQRLEGWLWAAQLPGAGLPLRYRLAFHFPDGARWETEDPYRFAPTVGEQDLYFFGEGTHRRLWRILGAHPRRVDGVEGVGFAVWAPNARRVSVVGDFNAWDGRRHPMRSLGASGVFELFVPGVRPGALYKYEILTREGVPRVKTDPFAASMEAPPGTASRVHQSGYEWRDGGWMQRRPGRDWHREPMSVYEVHLGSWARVPEEGNRVLTYREIAPRLADHARRFGFTHVELLPVAEHPFTGSWGYQVSGYYAPTARYGTPDDFRHFVDVMHQAGLGVIVDWVPAHFPKDDFALRRFDGTALFEHEDPRLGEHPDWGTLIFNYGRNEVRNFLVANALYWLEEFHVDGLRVDAVASMLYLDYSRKHGEWVPNRFGGRENIEAVEFLKAMNETVRLDQPGCFTVAEESTAWPGVTRPVGDGGLGFTFKWNMGWMHDTLAYFQTDPLYRVHHHDQLTFAMMYEYSEHFIMPLSHDEVVHGKGTLLGKMPGDPWQRFANLRTLFGYQYTRPGKQLLFMGAELGAWREWNHDTSLDWHLPNQDALHLGLCRWMEALGQLYLSCPAFWRHDHGPEGFRWLECCDRDNAMMSYARFDGPAHMLVATRLVPMPLAGYRLGVPHPGEYRVVLNSDAPEFGGSGFPIEHAVRTEPVPWHGYDHSVVLSLPPLGLLILAPSGGR